MIKDKKILFGIVSFLLILSTLLLFVFKDSEFLIALAYGLMIVSSVMSLYIKKRVHKTIISLLLGLSIFMLPLQIVLSSEVKTALTDTFTILVISLSSAVFGLYSFMNKRIYPSISLGFGILVWASLLSIIYTMQIDKTILLSLIFVVGFYPLIHFLEKSTESQEMLLGVIKSSLIFSLALSLYVLLNLFVLSGIKFNPNIAVAKFKEIVLSIGLVFLLINSFVTAVVVLSSLVILHMLGLKKQVYDQGIEFEKTEETEDEDNDEDETEVKIQKEEKTEDEFKPLAQEIKDLN